MVSLPEITMFVLCVAVTGLLVLEPVLDILHELSKHHPVTAAAAARRHAHCGPHHLPHGRHPCLPPSYHGATRGVQVVRFPGMRHGVMCPASLNDMRRLVGWGRSKLRIGEKRCL
ncbi:hypothetical protein HU200_037359 [Digitaria exilis]|uniref:Uncharacterized protein n=1 Tax=Digitaria exilis TaxID=1010633 RepID=A0A835BEV3_9POAL|nr:hypothetical protein HU200_037359 [Digitaria exilis]